jgi:beta-phosphoglucomutase
LYKKGITLILASSSAMVNIERVFDKFDLNPYFTAKISGADLTESKPHPEIFNKAALLGKTSKENCVVIEDSDNGVTAANDANIFVFGYANKRSEGQTLKNADFVIDDFQELKAFV